MHSNPPRRYRVELITAEQAGGSRRNHCQHAGRGVSIATRGCPYACDYCAIPQMYQRRMRYRPVCEVVAEIRRMPGRGILTRDCSRYNGKKDVIFRPARVSPQELLDGMQWAARRFYLIPSIAERMARSWTGLWWNLARNLGYLLALRNFGRIGADPAAAGQPA